MDQAGRLRAVVVGITDPAEPFEWDPRVGLRVTCPTTGTDFFTRDAFTFEELREPIFAVCGRCEAIHQLDLNNTIQEETVGDLTVRSIRRADGTVLRMPKWKGGPLDRA